MPQPSSWRDDPARRQLQELYAETDRALAGFTCPSSTDCCHFGRTEREPYPTAVEVAELEHAIRAIGGAAAVLRAPTNESVGGRRGGARALPVVDAERRCPLLSAEGRCRVYASRPFGCRTFFCERATHEDGDKMPRRELHALGRLVADLSASAFDRDPGPRTLGSALQGIRDGKTVLVARRVHLAAAAAPARTRARTGRS
ncbi:MAG: YkgJ family cysteine cluster protein [Myxococcales bacterium]|nr:YkgJ family cysteine cluster protein [Myxococcales bacterium]